MGYILDGNYVCEIHHITTNHFCSFSENTKDRVYENIHLIIESKNFEKQLRHN